MKLEISVTFSWLGKERNRMKASKFTEAPKAFILKQGEQGTPVAENCRKAGISQSTYFSWRIEASLRHWFERDAEGMAGCCLTTCGG